jgi:hypothetical protein
LAPARPIYGIAAADRDVDRTEEEASAAEKTALFSGTAMAVYRLTPADLE